MMSIDLRILTGPSLMLLGTLFLTFSWRLWKKHPVDRALRLAPYVTEKGLRAVINWRMHFFAFGLFLGAQGLSGLLFWTAAGRDFRNPLVTALGSIAACFGLWTAGLALKTLVTLWRGR